MTYCVLLCESLIREKYVVSLIKVNFRTWKNLRFFVDDPFEIKFVKKDGPQNIVHLRTLMRTGQHVKIRFNLKAINPPLVELKMDV